MRNFLNKNVILTASQYGFKRNSSTELAITTLYDKLLDNLNNKKTTCSIFLDLKKAFDSVSHDILLKKLEHCGFCGSVWKLLNSYLTEVESSWTSLTSRTSSRTHFQVLGLGLEASSPWPWLRSLKSSKIALFSARGQHYFLNR